jgi:hypothetical protein
MPNGLLSAVDMVNGVTPAFAARPIRRSITLLDVRLIVIGSFSFGLSLRRGLETRIVDIPPLRNWVDSCWARWIDTR